MLAGVDYLTKSILSSVHGMVCGSSDSFQFLVVSRQVSVVGSILYFACSLVYFLAIFSNSFGFSLNCWAIASSKG
jgi:hypothetical protein